MEAETRAHPHRGRLAAWLVFVGSWSALAYSVRLAGGADTPDEPLYRYGTAISGAITFGLLLAVGLAIAGFRHGPARELLGWRSPSSWKLAAGLSLLVLVAVYALAAVLSLVGGLNPGEEQGLLPSEWRPDRLPQYAANFALIVGFAPVVEELLFRGLGYSLLRPFGRWPAIVLVGVAFAAAHGLVEAFPLLALFGVGLAWIRDRTGSVLPCIVLHGLFNGIAMLAVFARAPA